MCMHDGLDEECPGRSCLCPCDSCVLGFEQEDDDDDDDCPWCPFGGTPLCCSNDAIVAQGGPE